VNSKTETDITLELPPAELGAAEATLPTDFVLMAELTDKLPFKLSARDTSCFAHVVRALNARCDTEDTDEAQSTTGEPPAYQVFFVAR
jgi:hypothetical protein